MPFNLSESPVDKAVEAFAREQILEATRLANQRTEAILADIAARLRPGMTESEARTLANEVFETFRHQGLVKHWHPPKIYFGHHTALSIEAPHPKDDRVLGDRDMAYLDLGPVFSLEGRDIEGDVGRTLVFGDDPVHRHLQATCESLFHQGLAFWKETRPTGVQLYQYLRQEAQNSGVVFNLNPGGHVIGAFPHHRAWRHALSDYPHIPQPGIWILEVQVRHPDLPYGAFYEALLE